VNEFCSKGSLPLHYAINRNDASPEVIKMLLNHAPNSIRVSCSRARLPIHLLLNRPNPNLELLNLMIEMYPESLKVSNGSGQIPLHKVVDQLPINITAFDKVFDGHPGGARVIDNEGYCPLHIAVDCLNPNEMVVEKLINAYPDAAKIATSSGLLPLHYVVAGNSRPSPTIVQLLLDNYPAATQHLIVDRVPTEDNADPNTWEGAWKDSKWTPFSKAVERNLYTVVVIMKRFVERNRSEAKKDEQAYTRRESASQSRKHSLSVSPTPILQSFADMNNLTPTDVRKSDRTSSRPRQLRHKSSRQSNSPSTVPSKFDSTADLFHLMSFKDPPDSPSNLPDINESDERRRSHDMNKRKAPPNHPPAHFRPVDMDIRRFRRRSERGQDRGSSPKAEIDVLEDEEVEAILNADDLGMNGKNIKSSQKAKLDKIDSKKGIKLPAIGGSINPSDKTLFTHTDERNIRDRPMSGQVIQSSQFELQRRASFSGETKTDLE
jgi:hypothetical protein